jgi:hypothetical protein
MDHQSVYDKRMEIKKDERNQDMSRVRTFL